MSGADNSTANLFLSAANLLLGERSDATGDHDAKQMLRALDYAVTEPAARGFPETVNRARLLMAASRSARVFELAAPDAPGLVSFGAQFDPVLANPLHAGSPMVGVSGVDVSLQEAFQGCIGEGIEYLSQCKAEAPRCSKPASIKAWPARSAGAELIADLSERRTRRGTELCWHRATRLSDGCEVLLPARTGRRCRRNQI